MLDYACDGVDDAEISRRLGIDFGQLEEQWGEVCRQLGVGSREEAIAVGLRAHARELRRTNATTLRELRRLRKAAAAAEAKNEAYGYLRDGMMIADTDGVITHCSPRMASLLGQNVEDVIGRTVVSFIGPAEGHLLDRRMELTVRDLVSSHDVAVMVDDGKLKWLRFSCSCLPSRGGRPPGLVIAVTDLTPRKRLERALRRALSESEERRLSLEAVLDLIPVGVALYAPDGEIVRANRRILALLGQRCTRLPSKSDLKDADCRWLANGSRVAEEEWIVRRLLAGEDRIAGPAIRLKSADGKLGSVLMSGAAIRSRTGEVGGAIVVAVDLAGETDLGVELSDADNGGLGALAARLVEVVESMGHREAEGAPAAEPEHSETEPTPSTRMEPNR